MAATKKPKVFRVELRSYGRWIPYSTPFRSREVAEAYAKHHCKAGGYLGYRIREFERA